MLASYSASTSQVLLFTNMSRNAWLGCKYHCVVSVRKLKQSKVQLLGSEEREDQDSSKALSYVILQLPGEVTILGIDSASEQESIL